MDLKEFASNLPTFQKYCYNIWITRETLSQWVKQGKNPKYNEEDKELKRQFSDAYTHAKQNQESIWLENSLKSLYNPQFAIFLWKNVFWYKDKVEQKVEHSWEIKNTWSLIWALTAKRDQVVWK